MHLISHQPHWPVQVDKCSYSVPFNLSVDVVGDEDDRVDGDVDGDDLCMIVAVAVHAADDALARANHEPYWPV